MLFGLKPVDVAMIVGYFVIVMGIGFWAARRVKSEADYFMGGRSFGKALLVMHWLATGTHSEQAVQVTGATARVGLGGIWYQWMWLFSTPFYWLIAPITRRMRVMTTGDFFRIRYGRSLEMLYSVVALAFYIQSMAMLLRGAGAAISGATGGAIPTEQSVVVLSILFSTYVMAGGLVAAAYTDFLQGTMIIVLSVLLVPAGLNLIGGMHGLHQNLGPEMLAVTAPHGSKEGDPWFVLAMSVLGLVGIAVQPHTMTATGSGKTETEARVGMCYGNFIKRFLTIAWAFTGLIAAVQFPEVMHGLQDEPARHASETLFGRSIQVSLGDGWRGLMIACLIAGVTSAETFMVVGASLFTRNFYAHVARNRTDHHYLWVGRGASVVMLGLGITVAFFAGSVTQILLSAIQLIGLLGAGFWLGVLWRRANAAGVWAGFLGGLLVWTATTFKPELAHGIPLLEPAVTAFVAAAKSIGLRDIPAPIQVLLMLAAEFGLLILVSLLTKPHPEAQLNAFYARLHTPVGREAEMRLEAPAGDLPESATLGMDGVLLDYHKSSALVYPRLQKLGIEIPRLNAFDVGGFLGAWVLVAFLIGLLIWLAGLGAA